MGVLDPARDRLLELPVWAQQAVALLAVFIAGYLVLWILRTYAIAAMIRSRHVDRTLRVFLSKIITSGGWVVLVVVLLSTAGVDLGALLGGLAIGGFIIGFALKDTLGNLAAGVMLLFYRPFNVDDWVELSGVDGAVTGLGMALTTLMAADGRIITMPNGHVLGGTIINHTRNNIRRADVMVGISYGDDIDTAVKAILAAVKEDARVLPDPAPDVRITTLGDNSVNLQVRPWVATPDIWLAKAELHGTVKRAVEAAGCTIPFPQRDVHVYQHGGQGSLGAGAGPGDDGAGGGPGRSEGSGHGGLRKGAHGPPEATPPRRSPAGEGARS